MDGFGFSAVSAVDGYLLVMAGSHIFERVGAQFWTLLCFLSEDNWVESGVRVSCV